MIELRVLGSLDLRGPEGETLLSVLTQPKRAALLAYLAVATPRGLHRRDTLVGLFWAERDQERARGALRTALYFLRQSLGSEVVATRGDEEVGLAEPLLWCDAAAFEEAVEAGELEKALELYRGDLLEGFFVAEAPEFERWLESERSRLRGRAAEAARALADREEVAGNRVEAAGWARRAAAFAPYDEGASRRLIELLDRLGDRAGAAKEYEAFAQRLREEYEVEPSDETQALIARIKQAKAAVTAAVTRPHEPVRRRPLKWPYAAAFVTVAAVAVAVGLLVLRGGEAVSSVESKSVAVLPFLDVSSEVANEYLSDAITVDIHNRLSKIADLQVVSRTSSMQYKGTDRNLRRIAGELRVANILEGEVQQLGERVRINAQLIDARTDVTVWAEQYDRNLHDAFDVQSEVALQIAAALQATLTPIEREEIERTPTDNLEAYGYYLRAIVYLERSEFAEDAYSAVQMLQRAVELDPEFAEAWAYLSLAHGWVYWMHWDRSEARSDQAESAVARALELRPGMGEAHLASGYYYYWRFLDYDRAVEQFVLARNSLPNEAWVWAGIAAVRRRQGEFAEAIHSFEKTWELNPRSAVFAYNLADTYALIRDFDQAKPYYDQAIVLNPEDPYTYWAEAWLHLRWHGDIREARTVLAQAQRRAARGRSPVGLGGRYRGPLIEWFDRRYSDVLDLLLSTPTDVLHDNLYLYVPKVLLCAETYGLLGQLQPARAHYDSARAVLEAELEKDPQDARLHSALGIAFAGLGMKEEAIREGELGVQLMPIEKEAWRGVHRVEDLARIYTMLGESDLAVDRLEYLLSIPGELTVPLLRIDPTWDSLRDHPRFQPLLEKYE
jgi:TolB-like protein/DNA-binding SARP family transcriptional activator/Flp pilus assembly protein TadD